uniref:Uncharacterized protein n=1 Tax=Arundo donax TaxID=35708 RepID=A0A0A8ZKQ6_ARUDO
MVMSSVRPRDDEEVLQLPTRHDMGCRHADPLRRQRARKEAGGRPRNMVVRGRPWPGSLPESPGTGLLPLPLSRAAGDAAGEGGASRVCETVWTQGSKCWPSTSAIAASSKPAAAMFTEELSPVKGVPPRSSMVESSRI